MSTAQTGNVTASKWSNQGPPAGFGGEYATITGLTHGPILIQASQDEANLIAAAPELLEVLQQIIGDGMHCDVVPHLHAKAIAAISKATGGSTQPDHFQPSQPLRPGAVSRPVGGAVCGHTAIVVQDYALGIGVSVPGDGYDLGRTERAFELETPRGRLVIDPGRARLAEWLVLPVQGDVAPVGQALQAVDQEDGSEIRGGDAVDIHDEDPPLFGVGRTAILSLPQGWGKSSCAHELARRLGCTSVVDDWPFPFDITPGALHLSNAPIRKGGAA
jgi:hypothetical protein